MHAIRKGKHHIFRALRGTNLMEFFAVSVEVFFEQTNRFALVSPLLFERMSLLLQQDPRKKEIPEYKLKMLLNVKLPCIRGNRQASFVRELNFEPNIFL